MQNWVNYAVRSIRHTEIIASKRIVDKLRNTFSFPLCSLELPFEREFLGVFFSVISPLELSYRGKFYLPLGYLGALITTLPITLQRTSKTS
jgi:hypothetical protein